MTFPFDTILYTLKWKLFFYIYSNLLKRYNFKTKKSKEYKDIKIVYKRGKDFKNSAMEFLSVKPQAIDQWNKVLENDISNWGLKFKLFYLKKKNANHIGVVK